MTVLSKLSFVKANNQGSFQTPGPNLRSSLSLLEPPSEHPTPPLHIIFISSEFALSFDLNVKRAEIHLFLLWMCFALILEVSAAIVGVWYCLITFVVNTTGHLSCALLYMYIIIFNLHILLWNNITLFLKVKNLGPMMAVHCMHACWECWTPWTGVTDGCETPCGCRELTPSSLEKQPVFLPTQTSLHPLYMLLVCVETKSLERINHVLAIQLTSGQVCHKRRVFPKAHGLSVAGASQTFLFVTCFTSENFKEPTVYRHTSQAFTDGKPQQVLF